MSESLFDKESWKRVMPLAIRATGYLAVIYLLFFLLIVVPSSYLVSIGAPIFLYELITVLATVLFVVAFFAVIFKVLDEIKPTQ